jgi:hypothetical protein
MYLFLHARNRPSHSATPNYHITPLGWELARLSLKFELGIPYERVSRV